VYIHKRIIIFDNSVHLTFYDDHDGAAAIVSSINITDAIAGGQLMAIENQQYSDCMKEQIKRLQELPPPPVKAK
jgi:hypothetical protein